MLKTTRMVYVAKNNTRYGSVPNISLVPIRDCGNNQYCRSKCYGVSTWKLYENTRNAWGNNSAWFRNDPKAACQQVYDFLLKNYKKAPSMFRIHVAGDFLSQAHVDAWSELASNEVFKNTIFLAYTKMYMLDFSNRPINFEVLASQWPDAPLLSIKGVRRNAWIETDYRKPSNAFQCLFDIDKKNHMVKPRTCDKCTYCWTGTGDMYLRLF